VLVLGVYSAVALAGYAACFAFAGGEADVIRARLAEATAQVQRRRGEIRALSDKAATVRRELEAIRSVAGHPDWSLLLTLLADALSDSLVLEICTLAPTGPPGSIAKDKEADPNSLDTMTARLRQSYVLQLAGVAKTQTAVSRFVLRLEQIGLFRRVKLVQTSRRTFAGRRAIVFKIECLLDGREEGTTR